MAAPLRPGQLSVIALAATAAVLAVVIAAETGWGEGLRARLPVKAMPAAAPIEPKLLPQLAATSPEQAWPETAARPIFVPGRRPAPTANAPTAMRKGLFILQGTTIVGPLSIAMFKEIASGKFFRVEKGKELQGMTLAEVAPDRATLKMGDDAETLMLVVTRAQPGAKPVEQAGPFKSEAPAAAPAPAPATTAPAAPPAPAARAAGAPQPAAPAAAPGPVPVAPGSAPPPTAGQPNITPDMSPEEMLARRRAARRAQQAN
jgi:hypothetical protein